jgi:subtilisin-like proprotein convertase family protein
LVQGVHKTVGTIYCDPDNTYLNYKWVPENCTWTAKDTKLVIGIDNTLETQGAAYILQVKEALVSEGSTTGPVPFNYTAGKAAATGRVSIGGTSYYKVSGLQAGMNYLLTLNNVQWEISRDDSSAKLVHYGADSSYTTPGTCTQSNTWPIQCQLTSSGSTLYFKVVGPTLGSGVTYNLSVTPVPITEGGGYQVPPVVLASSSLPYKGQVGGEFESNYTITGLLPNTHYQVFMNDITGYVALQTWSNGTGVTNCLSPESQSSATCALHSDATGEIAIVRASPARSAVSPSLGSLFTIDVKPVTQLTAKYQNKSGPIDIDDPTEANNPVTPTLVPIDVSGDPVTSISKVTVELFIRHGYASDLTIDLIAPDGTVVNLVEKGITGGSLGFYNTKLDDYAGRTLETAQYPYNHPYYGSFWPRTPLHVLNGMNANGTWKLRIKDDQWTNRTGQTGEYYAWGISFQ